MEQERQKVGLFQLFGEDGSNEQVKDQYLNLLKLKTERGRFRFLDTSPKTRKTRFYVRQYDKSERNCFSSGSSNYRPSCSFYYPQKVQILSFLWAIIFGGLTIKDILSKKKIMRVNHKIIAAFLLGVMVFAGTSVFFSPQILIEKLFNTHNASTTPIVPSTYGTSPTLTSTTPIISTVTTVINGVISTKGTSYSKVINAYNSITMTSSDWNDRLNIQEDKNNDNEWSTYNGHSTSCVILSDAYEVSALIKGYVAECFAKKTNFKNFAYQADMYIRQGLSGGLIFRAGGSSYNAPMYRFDINHAGIFDIYVQPSNVTGHNIACGIQNGKNQYYCYSLAINKGYNDVMNQLLIVAQRNTFYFYVNGTPLLVMVDNNYSAGVIGTFAADFPSPTKVDFRNAKVWTHIPSSTGL